MSRDLNKVMLIGRLGADPEMRYTASGTAVTNFRVACTRRRRGGQEGDVREETDWFTVVAWEKLAEITSSYLTKGSKVYVEGRLQTRSWDDQSGQKRYATEVVANDMIMLDSRRGDRAEGDEVGGDPMSRAGGMEDIEDMPF